jgi:hypothetical protein
MRWASGVVLVPVLVQVLTQKVPLFRRDAPAVLPPLSEKPRRAFR